MKFKLNIHDYASGVVIFSQIEAAEIYSNIYLREPTRFYVLATIIE